MYQNNRRGQRGAAREKHICSESMDTVWSQSGKCLSCMKYSWFLHPRAEEQHTNAGSCGTIPAMQSQACPMCPVTRVLALLSALPAQCNWEILVTEGISNILSPSHKSTAAKSTQFSLLQKQHITCFVWKELKKRVSSQERWRLLTLSAQGQWQSTLRQVTASWADTVAEMQCSCMSPQEGKYLVPELLSTTLVIMCYFCLKSDTHPVCPNE